jgi:hypothetical protein
MFALSIASRSRLRYGKLTALPGVFFLTEPHESEADGGLRGL